MTAAAPIAEPGAGIGLSTLRLRRMGRERVVPVLAVLVSLAVLWYAAAVFLNWQTEGDKLARTGQPVSFTAHVLATWSAERPILPAPHQIVAELWKTTVATRPSSPRSLLFHAYVTLSSTLVGFALGTVLGILLAVGILHSRTLERSLMPWIIASQTVPILAVAPMIIVVLNAVGVVGLIPKAIISTYLSFFPVTVGMAKGLASPDRIHLDLMRTYAASRSQVLGKLRAPASLPFLFASMKIAVAASLVGAIVGELPTGAVAGLGARLLAGSYYGQTIQIWSALAVAALLAGALVGLVSLAERVVLRRSGSLLQ